MGKYETHSDQVGQQKPAVLPLTKKEIFTLYAMQALISRTDITPSALPAKAVQFAEDTLQRLNESLTSDIPKSS